MGTGLRRIDPVSRAVIVRDYKYPYVLFEYSGGDLEYMGVHNTHGTATSDSAWGVSKFTYSADGIVRIEELEGAWDDRATLSWI